MASTIPAMFFLPHLPVSTSNHRMHRHSTLEEGPAPWPRDAPPVLLQLLTLSAQIWAQTVRFRSPPRPCTLVPEALQKRLLDSPMRLPSEPVLARTAPPM